MKKIISFKSRCIAVCITLTVILCSSAFAENISDTAKPQKPVSKLKVTSYIVANYIKSLNNKYDVGACKEYVSDSGVVNNSFGFQYIRVQGNYEISDRIDASVLVNLKELKAADVQKVIELAFIRYKVSKDGYLNLQVGQFRPYNQVEDLYGFQLHKSYIWSNQYTALAASNWTSFQMGAAITGSLKKSKVPLNYYVTVWNGNGRTASPYNSDNDNSKNVALRADYEITKFGTVGASVSSTKYLKKAAHLYSFDWRNKLSLSKKVEMEYEASYSTGTDISLLASVAKTIPAAALLDYDKYAMRGFYILPMVRYKINTPSLNSVEFSFRYENWDQNMASGTVVNGVATNGTIKNIRQTFIPMLSFNLAEKYGARVELIGVFNKYDRNLTPVKSKENSYCNFNQLALQFQFLF